MTREVVRLAIRVSHPIQYFSPVFRELTKQPGIDLTVLYCSRAGLEPRRDERFGVELVWDVPLLQGYRYKFFESLPRGAWPARPFSLFNPGIFRELWRERYDVLIVHGYVYPTCWLAFLGAKATATKLFLRAESQLLSKRPLWRRALKAVPVNILSRMVDGYLAIGSDSARYAQHYGVPPRRVSIAPYCVDNEFFSRGAKRGVASGDKMLQDLNLDADVILFGFFGKLYGRKAPFDVLRAFEKSGLVNAALLFVGDGESRRELEQYVGTKRISNVRFVGFVNQSEIPKYYGVTDVLVLPSRAEPWGLVVNEAMACGCAVVVSDACGCAVDLVHEGKNGYTFRAGDVEALARILRELAQNPEGVRAMGRASREMIQGWSPRISAKRIAQAAKQVCR